MAKPETVIEDYLVAETEKRGGWAAKMVDLGRKGAPDRELRFPKARIYWAETKSKVGRYEAGQERYAQKLESLGFGVWTLNSKMLIDKFFVLYDKGLI